MTYVNPRYTNEIGGIVVDRLDGTSVYLDPNSSDNLRAMAGEFGELSDYIPPPAPTQEDMLAAKRAAMVCSRLQGRLVLGQATCDALDAIAVDDTTPWAMRQTILHAIEWRRTSQAMTELGYLLGYTDIQMDELFEIAMGVEV